jgi:hypothetical protein
MPMIPPVATTRIAPRSIFRRRRSRPGTMPWGRAPPGLALFLASFARRERRLGLPRPSLRGGVERLVVLGSLRMLV